MASPLYDALSVQHSKNISDPVASASTNGARWTSAQRDYHLNTALKALRAKHIAAALAKEDMKRDATYNWFFLNHLIAEEAQALSTNLKAVSSWTGTASDILDAYNVTDSLRINRVPEGKNRFVVEAGQASFATASAVRQYWVLDGANFRLLDGTATSTDSIKLRYVKAHTDMSAGAASDTTVPSSFWFQWLGMAFVVAKMEEGAPDMVALAAAKEAEIDKEIFAGM